MNDLKKKAYKFIIESLRFSSVRFQFMIHTSFCIGEFYRHKNHLELVYEIETKVVRISYILTLKTSNQRPHTISLAFLPSIYLLLACLPASCKRCGVFLFVTNGHSIAIVCSGFSKASLPFATSSHWNVPLFFFSSLATAAFSTFISICYCCGSSPLRLYHSSVFLVISAA